MNRIFRKNSKITKIVCAVSAAAVVTCGIAFYLSKDTRVLASAMAEGKEVPQNLDAISAINYATILGRATDFGIVANDFEQITHMETTFAVNTFSNSSGQVNEVDFITNSAQFMVGQIGTGKVKFGGSQTARSYNIEASTFVFDNFQTEWDSGRIFNDTTANTSNFYFDDAQHTWRGTTAKPVYTVIKEQSAINANINNVINNATTSSDYISARANDPAYALDYTQYLTLERLDNPEYDPMDPNTGNINTANRFYIDIDKAEFVNRVVYINVDANLARVMAASEGLCIIKDPSTVVCFNIEPGISNSPDGGLILNRLDVSEDGGENFCWSVTASQGNTSGAQSTGTVGTENSAQYTNADVDRMINQKIILNVRSDSQNIQLDAIAGTTLIPNPSSIANVKGSSTGWVVAGGKLRNAGGEWHYIYQGGSQDLINQNTGNEIHFALHKNFTSDNGATIDNTVFIQEGQFTFNLYSLGSGTGSNYFDSIDLNSITPSTPKTTMSNKATGNVQFDPMSFTPGDYYFIINEEQTQNTNTDIVNSDGYIKIHLQVAAGDPANIYTVHYAYYMHAGDTTPYREEKDVVMMGVQFDLGGFFNYVQPTGSISIDKSVLGVVDVPGDYVAPVYVKSGNTYYGVDASGDLITSQDPVVNNVHPGSTYILRDLPLDQSYTITEASHPDITDYTFVSVSGDNTSVTLSNASPNANVSLQNTYKNEDVSNILYLAKIGSDTNQLLEGASFTLDYSGEGSLWNVAVTGVSASNANNNTITFTTVDSANVSFTGLPNGSYTLTEDSAPAGYSTAAPVAFTLNNGQLTFDGTAPSYALFDNDTHILTITDQSNLGTLRINKTIALASGFNGTITKADLGTIEFSITGPASFNNGNPLVVSLNAFDLVSGTYVFEQDVPAGTYTITEVRNGANSWYSCVTTAGAVETNTANVNVEIDETGSASFVNTYSPTTGSLVITKTVYGITDIASVDAIEFEITAPSGSTLTTTSVTLDSNWSSNGWTKNGNTYTYVFSNVTPGYYQIREVTTGANSSYTCTVVPNSSVSTATVYAGDIPIVPAAFTNTYSRVTGTVEISKVIAGGTSELPGAELQIISTSGANMSGCSVTGGGQSSAVVSRDLISFTSGTAPTSIAGLPQGTYRLHENAAPAGYLVSTDINFTVGADGSVTGTGVSTSSGHAVITMEDKAVSLDISKIQLNTSGSGDQYVELPGAVICIAPVNPQTDISNLSVNLGENALRLSDGENSHAIYFRSGNSPTRINALPDGTYTLTETTVPTAANGYYSVATTVEFTITDGVVVSSSVSGVVASNENGNHFTAATDSAPAKIALFDAFTQTATVDISKIELAPAGSSDAYQELPGATICIASTDSNVDISGAAVTYRGGAVPAQGDNPNAIYFVSGTAPTSVTLPNGTYTLTETAVPESALGEYTTASQVTFTISDGVVTSSNVTGVVVSSTDGNHFTEATATDNAKIELFDAFVSSAATPVDISKIELAPSGSADRYQELPGAVICIASANANDDISNADIQLGAGAATTTGDNNKAVYFVSGTAPTTVSLPDGTYTLTETTVPTASDGYYSVATEITFTIENGVVSSSNVTGVVASNADGNHFTAASGSDHARFDIFDAFTPTTDISVSKIELAPAGSSDTYQELPGATICIASTDSNVDISNASVSTGTGATKITGDNNKAIYFISGSTPTTVSLPDGTYTLTETLAPSVNTGYYDLATEITFTIENGVVTSGNVTGVVASNEEGNHFTEAAGSTPAHFEMFDRFTSVAPTTVDISKIELAPAGSADRYQELPGATICIASTDSNVDISGAAVTYGGGATPTTGSNPRAIYFVSGNAPTSVTLPNGTYTLTEKTVPTASNGYYSVATEITFTVNNGTVTASNTSGIVASGVDGNHFTEATGNTPAHFEMFDAFTYITDVDVSKIELAPAGSADRYQELPGATICIASTDSNVDLSGVTVVHGGGATPATGSNPRAIYFVSGNAPTRVSLPDGTYTLTETTVPTASNGYYSVATEITFTIENGVVSSSNVTGVVASNADGNHFTEAAGSTPAHIELFDRFTYTTNVDVSKIELNRTGSGPQFTELPGATICIAPVDANVDISDVPVALGTGALTASGNNAHAVYFISGTTPTTVSLPDGVYDLTEVLAPTSGEGTYSTASTIRFTITNGAVTSSSITGIVALNAEGNHYVGPTYGTNSRFELFDAFTPNPTPVTTTVAISKQNTGNQELQGATLQLSGTTAAGPVVFDAAWYAPGTGASATAAILNNGETLEFVSGTSPSYISNLPDGSYTLVETVAPSGYSEVYVTTTISFTISNGVVTSSSADARVETDTNNTPVVVMVDQVDTTIPDTCTLRLLKVVEANGANVPGTYTFFVTDGTVYYGFDANGAVITDTNPIPVTVTPGAAARELTGLPSGTYTVSESREGIDVSGYTLNVTGEGSVTLDAANANTRTATVTIRNTYTSNAPATGSLTIVKNIGDGAPTSAYAMDYTFTVTGPNGYSTDVVIHGAGSTTLTGLEPGTYTVTEQASSAAIGGYLWTATGDGVAAVNVVAGDTPSVVTITNTYNETTAATSATTYETTTEATTEATTQSSETAATSETTATTTEVTTRVYITAMDINISKQDIAGAEIDGAVLTITNAPGNAVNFLASGVTALQNGLPASGLEVTADKLQFTTVSSSQALIHNLPVGHYVLTETIAPRGYLIAESINFEVRNDGTIWVAGTPEDQMVERIVMQDLADPTVGQAADRATPVVSRVTINGTEVTPDHYTINSDGTVTINAEYARVLGVGRHRIEVTMSDGTTRILYITVNSDGSVIQTGESRVSASSVLAVVMLAAGGMVFIVRKKLIKEEQ